MKISENRRLRCEKKSRARHVEQHGQASRAEIKYMNLAKAMAEGGAAAAKIDLKGVEKILKSAGHTAQDLQVLVDEIRADNKA